VLPKRQRNIQITIGKVYDARYGLSNKYYKIKNDKGALGGL
jgi:hypothetical protein